MTVSRTTSWLATSLAACLASVVGAACGGASPASENLGASTPWSEPREPHRDTRTAEATQPSIELVPHGVQPIQQGADEVVLVSVVEVVNHTDAAMPMPPLDLVGEVVTADGRESCAPSTTPSDRELAAGERRMVWVRTTCPVAGESQVVRITAYVEGNVQPGTEVGEAIVGGGIATSATAGL